MRIWLQKLWKQLNPAKCNCSSFTPYPHISVIACNDCGSIEFVGSGFKHYVDSST
jgi:hypothetical protein